MNKKFFVAIALLALSSTTAHNVFAQSCPNHEQFGVHAVAPVDKTLQTQIEVTYFTTEDPNVFISELAGVQNSATYTRLNNADYFAKLEKLVREGVASVKKRQSASPYLGEIAELNLERNPRDIQTSVINANMSAANSSYVYALDRRTEISVRNDSPLDGEYYRVEALSWFVDVTEGGAQQIADYDASLLMKEGETAIIKLASDYEIKRSGAARSYMAITLRSSGNNSSASLGSRRTIVALKK